MMQVVIGLVCWAIGYATAELVRNFKRKHTVTRREFNNVDLRNGSYHKTVHYYKNGKRIG